jgi:sirohydrochlorin ferrochelatase
MKALILIAHGSRREASNDAVVSLSEIVAQDMQHEYSIVRAGFLELARPSIPDVIDDCVELGATEVVVVPYFLSAGRHVFEDVPGEVEKAQAVHVDIPMIITPHIGGSAKMKDLIREAAMDGGLSS